MRTLTPTKDTGATAKANEVVYVELEQTETDAGLVNQLGMEGVDAAFVADFLSACLTHARCGVHLYRSVANRTENPVLQGEYQRFGRAAEGQVELLEDLIAAGGGNPSYVSPLARATEAADTKAREATYLGSGGIDPVAAEMAMLDAVLLAETLNRANRDALAQLGETLPSGAMRKGLNSMLDAVAQEDDPLAWATEARLRLTMLQVGAPAPDEDPSSSDGLLARVKGWFGRGSGTDERSAPRSTKKQAAKKQAAAKKAATKKTAATKNTAAPKKAAGSKKKAAGSKKSAGSKKQAGSKKSSGRKKATSKKQAAAKAKGTAGKKTAKKR